MPFVGAQVEEFQQRANAKPRIPSTVEERIERNGWESVPRRKAQQQVPDSPLIPSQGEYRNGTDRGRYSVIRNQYRYNNMSFVEYQEKVGGMGAKGFKHYPDEVLNTRLDDVHFVWGTGSHVNPYLLMNIDGKRQLVEITNRDSVRAYEAGALPVNTLANAVLRQYDRIQAEVGARVDMGLCSERDQTQVEIMRR